MPTLQHDHYPFISNIDAVLRGSRQKYISRRNVMEIPPWRIASLDAVGILLIDGHSATLKTLPKDFVAIELLACKGVTFAQQLARMLGDKAKLSSTRLVNARSQIRMGQTGRAADKSGGMTLEDL
jgi:hypothetical protein